MRNKKEKTVIQDTLNKAENILNDFKDFISGYRVLFLIHRNKEGGDTNNTKVRKVIVKDEYEYLESLYSLLVEKESSLLPLRIYASVNERNFEKAIRQFKGEQLDNDYADIKQKHSFYTDTKNRFIGCLMSPSSAIDKKFMLDVDSEQEHVDVLKEIANSNLNDYIIKQYKTKNGWHIVMKPFNPALLPSSQEKINKDGLLLLSY